MKIAQIVPSLAEQHGGPSRSVRGLAAALARLGDDVDLLTTRPKGEAEPVEEGRLRVLEFRRGVPGFLCPSAGLGEHLYRQSYDCVHHHALWLRTLHYAHEASRITGARLVISPRGMMSDWAWHHHQWRKQLAQRFVHPGAFAGANGWHATSEDEAAEIGRRGFSQPVCVAPNGVEAPTAEEVAHAHEVWTHHCPAVAARPVALFYSRFHRKKRLLELLDLWIAEAPVDWLLLVAGVSVSIVMILAGRSIRSPTWRSMSSGRRAPGALPWWTAAVCPRPMPWRRFFCCHPTLRTSAS